MTKEKNKLTQKEATSQLHQLQAQLEHLHSQRNTFQQQLEETASAKKHVSESPESYKIIANIMVKQDATKLAGELSEKEQTLQVRIDALEKQEKKMMEKAKELQEVIKEQNK